MAGESAVDRAAMQTAANQLQSAVDTVRSAQSSLMGQQGEMMGGWQGNAASAFTQAFEAFNADYTKVIAAMQRIQEALQVNQRQYTASEEANTQLSTRVHTALNG